jgi:hypothetical protein
LLDNDVNSDAASFRVFLINATTTFLLIIVTTISIRCQAAAIVRVSSGHIPPGKAYRQTDAAAADHLTPIVGGSPVVQPGLQGAVSHLFRNEARR